VLRVRQSPVEFLAEIDDRTSNRIMIGNCASLGADDQVQSFRQRILLASERFPDQTLPPIPHYGIPHTARDRNSEPRTV